jgi:hypothetical protein
VPYVVAGVAPAAAVGPVTFTLTASDGSATATQSVTITVEAVKPAPTITITTRPPLIAVVNKLYSYAVTAQASDGSKLQFVLINDPVWIDLTDNGDGTATLAGTPASTNVGNTEVLLVASPAGDLSHGTPQMFTVHVSGITWSDLLDGNGQLVAAIRQCLETLEAMSEADFWKGAIAAVGQGSLPCIDEQGHKYGRMPYPVQLAIAQVYFNAARLQLPGQALNTARDRAGETAALMKARLRRLTSFPATKVTPDPDPVPLWRAASTLAALMDAPAPGTLKAGDPLPRAVRLQALTGVITDYLRTV